MKKNIHLTAYLMTVRNAFMALTVVCFTIPTFSATSADTSWIRLDNGVDLTGWWEWNKDPDKPAWKVEDGSIVASYPYRGRTHLLTENDYGNFIAEFEVWLDWEVDSGFFLRCTDNIRTYQITLDNRKNGSIGGVYGENLGGFKSWEWTLNSEQSMKGESSYFSKEDFSKVWNPTGWNKVRVSIHGDPPVITTWLNDYKNNHYVGEEVIENSVPSASIALQLKGHSGSPDKKIRFRNIRLTPLTDDGDLNPVSVMSIPEPSSFNHKKPKTSVFFDANGKIIRYGSGRLNIWRPSIPLFSE